MLPPHTEPHLEEDTLDQYAIGNLHADLIPAVEEHLLFCGDCQLRLNEADEFVAAFRAAAMKVLEEPQPGKHPWLAVFALRQVRWAGAMAVAALAITPFLLKEVSKRGLRAAPAVVMMQSFRSEESGATVAAMKPALLVFDVPANVEPADCTLEIVDLNGKKVVDPATVPGKGRLEALTDNLKPGNYWVRLYRRNGKELVAEYSLIAKK